MTTTSRPPTTNSRPLPQSLPELPQGWVWTTLGNVAEVRGGVTKGRDLTRFETIEAPYLRVANVQAGYLDLREIKTIAIKRDELAKYLLRDGDVLFTEGGDRDKLARGTVWHDEIVDCVHQNHIFCARPRAAVVLSEWLSLASQLPVSREYFWSVASQTVNLASISLTNLKAWPIPLPPLAEQRRIVERVEALLAQARTAREALAPLSTLVRRLRQSVLAAAFSGRLSEREPGDEPVTELLERIRAERALLGGRRRREEARALPAGLPELPEGWVWATVGEMADISGGIQKTPARQPRENHYPYLRVANVLRGRLDLSEIQRFELAPEELERWRLQSGDVLIVEGNGSLAEIGRCAIWHSEIGDCVHQNHLIRVRLSDAVVPKFFSYFLNSNAGRSLITATASSTSGLYTLSVSKVQRVAFPLAPLAEQHRIVACVEVLLAQANIIEQAAIAVRQRVADVERAVLARAFRGELVEQLTNGRIRTIS